MATTTLQNARRALGRYLGYGESMGKDGSAWTTTTNIPASTTVTSTELRDYGYDDFGEGGSGDDFFRNWWIIIHGTNNAQIIRRVKAYDASSGQLTVTGTALSAESGSTDFELHRASPTFMRQALNTVRTTAYPDLHLPLSRSLFTARGQTRYQVPSAIQKKPTAIYVRKALETDFANNILSNPGFEDWTSGSPDNWTVDGDLTVAEEELTTTPKNYMVLEGDSSGKFTNGTTGSAYQVYQTISSPGTHSGQRVSLYIWVYCLEASAITTLIRLNSTDHQGTTADGGVHRGTGWELLTHFEDSLETLTTLRVGFEFASTADSALVVYVDNAIAIVGPTQEPESERNRDYIRNWEYVPTVEGTTARNHVVFTFGFTVKRLLGIDGMDYLSEASSETDTFEIGEPQTELFYAHAAAWMFRQDLWNVTSGDGNLDRTRYREILRDVDRLSVHSMPQPRQRLRIPDWGV